MFVSEVQTRTLASRPLSVGRLRKPVSLCRLLSSTWSMVTVCAWCRRHVHLPALARKRLTILSVCLIGGLIFAYLNTSPLCLFPHLVLGLFPKLGPHDNHDITIVTAFFDLGEFQKGRDPQHRYTPSAYLRWAQAFRNLQNPLVVFTDSDSVENLFKAMSKTNAKIVRLESRERLFSFQTLALTRQVFADPSYPKFHPNTVLPDYSCSQHAKMDVLNKTVAWNYFHTKYYAWVDIGYFRHITHRRKHFWITVPRGMDDKKVAVSEIQSPDFRLRPEEIFKTNTVWVGGGMLLATGEVLLTFVAEYHRALMYFLKRGLANTDQQVMYSMFTQEVRSLLNVTTDLQTFAWTLNSFRQCWFYLGYACYRE